MSLIKVLIPFFPFLHHDDKNNMFFLCSGRLMDIAGDVIFAGLYRDWQGMI